MIKPESITKQQAEKFAELMDVDFGRFLHDYQAIPLEKIANALIEAGIVSPPVWVIKKDAAIVSGCFSSHKNAVAYRDVRPRKGAWIETSGPRWSITSERRRGVWSR